MKIRLAIATFALAIPVAVSASAPLFVGIPRAEGSLLELSLQGVQLAKQLGFDGVSVDVGPGPDPLHIDVSNTKRLVHAAASLRLKLNCSMAHPPANDRWASVNGGIKWLTKSRYPSTVWPYLVKDLSARVAAVSEVYQSYGLDPEQWIVWEPFNEPGWRGVGGPHVGSLSDRQYETKYNKMADPNNDGNTSDAMEGYIERDQFERMAYVYEHTNWMGMKVGTPTLEGQQGKAQRMEIESFRLYPDLAQRIVAKCSFVGFNCYAPKVGSIAAVKSAYAKKIESEINLIRSLALFQSMPIVIQECNVFIDRVPRNVDPGEYRMAAIQAAMNLPGVSRATAFTLFSTNKATEDVGLFTRDGRAWPSGSSPVHKP